MPKKNPKKTKNTKSKKIKETEKGGGPPPPQEMVGEVVEPKPKNIEINININKELVFSNTSEIIAKNIIEIIQLNFFNEITVKKLDSLMVEFCLNCVEKELNNILAIHFLCYDKEKSFLNEIELFHDNYIRNDINEECNITQPSAPQLDRWKIHKTNVIKDKNALIDNNKNNNLDKQKLAKKNLRKITKKKTVIIEEKNNNNTNEIKKNKEKSKTLINILVDSFPSFPLNDKIFQNKSYLTKEQEKQVELFREEILMKEEFKRKEEERKMKRFEFLKSQSPNIQFDINENGDLEDKKKYFRKNIGVTANGDIIVIRNIDIRNLQSEFLKGVAKMKKDRKASIILDNNNLNNNINEEIEKNKIFDGDIDFYKEMNKTKLNKEFIIGGSSFDKFIPETGVNIKQGKSIKSGGNDFMSKYNKITYEQFEKTLEKFTKINLEKNDLLQIKKDDDIMTPKNNKEIKDYKNLYNYSNNTIKYKTIYNLNFSNNINSIKNAIQRSSSLPDVFTPRNSNSKNSLDKNDLTIKKNFYYTNYNNNNNSSSNFTSKLNSNTINNNYNNKLIKTSSSFKNLFNDDDEDNNKIISTKTSTNFFINFNKNFKILSKQKRTFNSLRKMQNFNSDIVNNKNWGLIYEKENKINNWNKMPNKNIVKNISEKNNFRIRTNLNEIYNKKANNDDILSFIRTGSNFNKKNKLKKNKKTTKKKQET